MIVNLRIDRLVLEGLPVETHQSRPVQAAIEAELARLLAEDGMVQPSPIPSRQSVATAASPPGTKSADTLGTSIGHAIFEGICR